MKRMILNSLVIFSLVFLVGCLEGNTPKMGQTDDSGQITAGGDVNTDTPVASGDNLDATKTIIVESDDALFTSLSQMLAFIQTNDFYDDWLFFKDIRITGRLKKSACGVDGKCFWIHNMEPFMPAKDELQIENPDALDGQDKQTALFFSGTVRINAPLNNKKSVVRSIYVTSVSVE